jgi:hypothetical protein
MKKLKKITLELKSGVTIVYRHPSDENIFFVQVPLYILRKLGDVCTRKKNCNLVKKR